MRKQRRLQAGVVFSHELRRTCNPKSNELPRCRQPDRVDVFDIRHSRPLLESDQQRLQRALLALGDDLDIAIGNVAAYADKLKLLRAVDHEVAETYALHAALNNSTQTLLVEG